MKSTYRLRLVAFALLALCLTAQLVSALTVEELVAELPAKDSVHAAQLYEAVAAGDEAVIVALCDSLALWQEGADPKIPMALDGLADHVMRPENAANRAKVARLYEAALSRADNVEKQRFFMALLRVCGDNDSIAAVAPYLCNAELFDDAIQTLEGIGGDDALAVLKKAKCPDMSEAFSVSLKTALIRMSDTVLYKKDVSRLDDKVLAAVSIPPEPKNRKRVVELCRKVLANKKQAPHVQALALRALINTEGMDALRDLIEAGESEEPVVWGTALHLSESLPGVKVSRAWKWRMDSLPEPMRPQIIYMLGGRDDGAAKVAIRDALASENVEMRLAACDAIGRYEDKEDFMAALERAMNVAQSNKEIEAIKNTLLQLSEPGLSESAARHIVYGENPQRIAYLEIIASRRADQHLKPVRKCLQNEDPQVRRAAVDALAVTGAPEDMATLFGRFLSEESDVEATAARNAIVAIADRHGLRPSALEQIQTLLSGAAFDSRVRLMKTLAALGDVDALAEVGRIADAAFFGENRDEALGNVALEMLGTWQNVRACDLLVDLFSRMEAEEQRMAVLLQIVIAAPRVYSDAPQQVEFLEKAQALCTTEAEKQLMTGAIEKAQPAEK